MHAWLFIYALVTLLYVGIMTFFVVFVQRDTLNLALVQYYFSQGVHKLKFVPHGNAHSGKQYVWTMPSMMCKLKEKARRSTPKRALKFLSEAGEILQESSAGALPHNRQQVKDARRKSTSKQEYDPLYAVMYACKEAEGKKCKDAFVRMVNAAPFPMMLLAFDYTLDDLVCFCTAPTFSVFGVDSTFNLGSFDVTVTTYRHLLLEYQQNPSVHDWSYFYSCAERFCCLSFFCFFISRTKATAFFSVGICTDGELALENALMATFPKCPTCAMFLAL